MVVRTHLCERNAIDRKTKLVAVTSQQAAETSSQVTETSKQAAETSSQVAETNAQVAETNFLSFAWRSEWVIGTLTCLYVTRKTSRMARMCRMARIKRHLCEG